MSLRALPAAIVLVSLAALPAAAQSGGIRVCVFDDRQQPLGGATVEITNDRQLTAPAAQITGADGCTLFPVLRVGGGYNVQASMPGFATYRVPNLRVTSGAMLPQALALTPELTERVEVTARSSVVDIDDTGSKTKFDDTFIENLPVPGRFYQSILNLAPGVQDSDGDGNPNIHGSRERDFRAMVDGVANTDPLTGEWLSLLNTDAIEEMEIVTTGAGVEYGRASGGFARIIQKQGSNDFEGLFSFIFRSSKLDGGAPGDLVAAPDSATYEWLQPAIQLSGPIVKDRLWYRVSHEWIDREDPIVTLSGVATTSRKQRIASDQITWQVSPRNKFSFTYQEDPTTIGNFGVSSRVPVGSTQRLERGGPTFRINWIAPVSPRLLVESTVAYQDLDRGFFPTNPEEPNSCALFGYYDNWFLPLNRAYCYDDRTQSFSGTAPDTWEDRRQRLTVSANATLFAGNLFGFSHRFKFGFVSENERYYRELTRRPSLNFIVETLPLGDQIGHTFARVPAPPFVANSATGNNWAVYVEDQFKPVQNLSITLGVRYDREEIFSAGQQVFDPAAESSEFERLVLSYPTVDNVTFFATAVFTGYPEVFAYQRALAETLDVPIQAILLGPAASQSNFWIKKRRAEDVSILNNNFSPRLTVAWDPWGNAKTKVSLSAGRYYDKIFLAVPLIELEPPTAELEFTSWPVRNQFVDIGFAGGFNPAITINTVSRDLSTPYQDEFTFGIERSIGTETSIQATYISRKYRDQIQDVDLNHVPGDKGRCAPADFFGQTAIVTSPGEGQTFIDPTTGEMVTDTDPGIGDGRLDDCTGSVLRLGGLFGLDVEIPDGLPDLYVLNPGWGEILEVGNYNRSDYEGFVLEVVRRLFRDWQFAASYTWSKATGDAEDFDQILGNERNLIEQERGFLSYDQRHVVKVNAMKVTRNGIRLGGSLRWESGLPFSFLRSEQTIWARSPVYKGLGDVARDFRFRYPSGARNDLRNPSYWTLDLRVAKEFEPRDDLLVQVTAEVFNALDDKTLVIADRIEETISGTYRFGRQYQIGLRVTF